MHTEHRNAVIHDVDLELLRRMRHAGTFQPWEDRRRGLYAVHYVDPATGEAQLF